MESNVPKMYLKNGCLEPKTQFPLGKLQKDMTTGVGVGWGGGNPTKH